MDVQARTQSGQCPPGPPSAEIETCGDILSILRQNRGNTKQESKSVVPQPRRKERLIWQT